MGFCLQYADCFLPTTLDVVFLLQVTWEQTTIWTYMLFAVHRLPVADYSTLQVVCRAGLVRDDLNYAVMGALLAVR